MPGIQAADPAGQVEVVAVQLAHLLTVGPTCRIQAADGAAVRLLATGSRTVIGSGLEPLVCEADREQFRDFVRLASQGAAPADVLILLIGGPEGPATVPARPRILHGRPAQTPFLLWELISGFPAALSGPAVFEGDHLLERISDAVVSMDRSGRILYANSQACQRIGGSRDDLIGQSHWARLAQFIGTPVYAAYEQAVSSGEPARVEMVSPLSGRWMVYSFYPSPTGVTLYVLDIDELRRAQQARRESEARLTTIIASAPDAIVAVDQEGRLIVVNPAAERMFGVAAAQAIGQPAARFLATQERKRHDEFFAALGRAGTDMSGHLGVRPPFMARRPDGSQFPIEASISTAQMDGRTVATIFIRDITARLEAESARRAARERHASTFKALTGLTPRERQVMDRVAAGQANKVIASELGLSPKTVEIHRGRMMKKMGATSVAQLVNMLLVIQPLPEGTEPDG